MLTDSIVQYNKLLQVPIIETRVKHLSQKLESNCKLQHRIKRITLCIYINKSPSFMVLSNCWPVNPG